MCFISSGVPTVSAVLTVPMGLSTERVQCLFLKKKNVLEIKKNIHQIKFLWVHGKLILILFGGERECVCMHIWKLARGNLFIFCGGPTFKVMLQCISNDVLLMIQDLRAADTLKYL